MRGEAGVGKSALLESLVARSGTCRIARAAGVESEMELAYAGLHQPCQPFLYRIDRLPRRQHDALGTAFGMATGPAPDRPGRPRCPEPARRRPLPSSHVLCVIDDTQWLDLMSARILAFVARRLAAESVIMIFAIRDGEDSELTGLAELEIRERDARAGSLPGMINGRLARSPWSPPRAGTMTKWEAPRISTFVAPARVAMNRSAAGAIALSPVGMTAYFGSAAGADFSTCSAKAEAATGRWAARKTAP